MRFGGMRCAAAGNSNTLLVNVISSFKAVVAAVCFRISSNLLVSGAIEADALSMERKSDSEGRLASVEVGDRSELHLGRCELAGESIDCAGL